LSALTCPLPRYNRHRIDVYEELVRLHNLGQKCALATIVEVRASIPSYETARFLVREDGSMLGTIGGGQFGVLVQPVLPMPRLHFRGRAAAHRALAARAA